MLNNTDMLTLEREYGRESLINTVRTAREYLRVNLGPVGLEYRGRPIVLDLQQWGKRGPNGEYIVCLGSMWYLLETGYLVEDIYPPTIVRFLDMLRYPLLGNKAMKWLLGVDSTAFDDSKPPNWEGDDPTNVLSFLDWVVGEYDRLYPKEKPIPGTYDMMYILDEPPVGADLPGYVNGAHYRIATD